MVKHNLTRWTVFRVALFCDVRKERTEDCRQYSKNCDEVILLFLMVNSVDVSVEARFGFLS